jgi:hypothetical protein
MTMSVYKILSIVIIITQKDITCTRASFWRYFIFLCFNYNTFLPVDICIMKCRHMYNEINLLKSYINWINRPRYRWNLNKTEQMRIASVKVYIDNVQYSLVHVWKTYFKQNVLLRVTSTINWSICTIVTDFTSYRASYYFL